MGPDWSIVPSGDWDTGVGTGGTAIQRRTVTAADVSGDHHIVTPKQSLAVAPVPRNQGTGKSGIRLEETAYAAEFRNLPGLRSQAEACFHRSELTADPAAKVHWLTLAEAWLMMANSVAGRDLYGGCEKSGFQNSRQENGEVLNQFLISSNANRRRHRRLRVLKEGKITNTEMRCLANVVIRDLSESGARVQLPAGQALPDDFGLYIVAEKLLYPAVARWREDKALGIQFVGEPLSTALLNGIS